MGACYSKQGHESAHTPIHKCPHSKSKPHKNGVAVKIEYTPVRPPDNDDDKIPDADINDQSEKVNGGNRTDPCEEGEESVADEKTVLLENKGGVAPSDSGIESLSPSETDQSERVTSNLPNGHSNLKLGLSANEGAEKQRDDQTYCSCGPRGAWNFSKHGECRTHYSTSSSAPSKDNKRNSDIIILKSSLKKKGEKSDRKYRLSWKSTDSLDWTATLVTSLDRCRSEASDLFGDDLSLRAPLAEFDSIDFLESTEKLSNAKRPNSFLEYNSDTFQFEFDFSGLDANRKSCDSAPVTPLTEEPLHQQNSVSVERVHVELPHSKRSSRDLRHFDSEPSLELSSLYPSLQDVKTMQMDGREVVVIDVETYGTIMEELAMLKLKLSQLTDFLQLQDQEQGGSLSEFTRERLDFSNTSSMSEEEGKREKKRKDQSYNDPIKIIRWWAPRSLWDLLFKKRSLRADNLFHLGCWEFISSEAVTMLASLLPCLKHINHLCRHFT